MIMIYYTHTQNKLSSRNVVCYYCDPITILCVIGVGILRCGGGFALRYAPERQMAIAGCIRHRRRKNTTEERNTFDEGEGVDPQEYIEVMENRIKLDPKCTPVVHMESTSVPTDLGEISYLNMHLIPILGGVIIVYGWRIVHKTQSRLINDNKLFARQHKHFGDANTFRERIITDNKNLLNNHEHIDRFYPTTHVDRAIARSNARIWIFFKANLGIEASVSVPNSDAFNQNGRLKLPYFLQDIRKESNNPICLEMREKFGFEIRNIWIILVF